jgi:lipopolysaccharide/colanic/teichoic acid biosynthesis glycosyltransferase
MLLAFRDGARDAAARGRRALLGWLVFALADVAAGALIERLRALGASAAASRTVAALGRGLDVAVGSVCLLLFAPLFPLIALLVRLDSPGPVFYVAPRVGQGGRVFRMWKFRTMVADGHGGRRLTAVGRVLRSACMDELPQLVGLVRGDLALVGPRPGYPGDAAAPRRGRPGLLYPTAAR